MWLMANSDDDQGEDHEAEGQVPARRGDACTRADRTLRVCSATLWANAPRIAANGPAATTQTSRVAARPAPPAGWRAEQAVARPRIGVAREQARAQVAACGDQHGAPPASQRCRPRTAAARPGARR